MSYISIPREPMSRRAALRGLGATVALPFLDAMMPSARAAQGKAFPTRLGVVFMPNGVRQDCWTPEGEGSGFKFSPVLQPLERHREHVNVLTQLGHANCQGGDGHYAKTANWLTGTTIEPGLCNGVVEGWWTCLDLTEDRVHPGALFAR
jgi:hypothetical protein